MYRLPDKVETAELDPPEARKFRWEMVEYQLAARGVGDFRVLDAMRRVPRHLFCPADTPLAEAYGDFPLSVGHGQTISQPWMVAEMLQRLELTGSETVLEVGTGSGYNAALLGVLAHRVVTVEVIPELAESARRRLEWLGLAGAAESVLENSAASFENLVTVVVGDGSLGWPAGAPYDGIIVTAGAPDIPVALQEQLREGGRLVIPVGDRFLQELLVIRRERTGFFLRQAGGCRFVPLVGRQGWG